MLLVLMSSCRRSRRSEGEGGAVGGGRVEWDGCLRLVRMSSMSRCFILVVIMSGLYYSFMTEQAGTLMKMLLLAFIMVQGALSIPNYGSRTCPDITPCSSFCGYSIAVSTVSQIYLSSGCGSSLMNNGACTVCD